MRCIGSVVRRRIVDHADVKVTWPDFRAAVQDLADHAGDLAPTANWIPFRTGAPADADVASAIADGLREENFRGRFDSLDRITYEFIGSRQQRPIGEPPTDRYSRLLRSWDPLGLWQHNIADPAIAATLRVADLGTIFDLNMVHEMPRIPRPVTRILEVGGGYGRLAEGAFNVFGDSVRYVLVDSVPGSLCYAEQYLRHACPDIAVGSYLRGDPFDLDRFHCYILPPWHLERIAGDEYDVLISVNSLQEMAQHHVDWYLGMFDDVAADGAICYLNNARDYLFQGTWSYPAHWQKLLAVPSPRSWSDDHPTEVFRVDRGADHRKANGALDALYAFNLAEIAASR